MTREHFKKQMDRLASKFGEKNYDTDTMRLFWREISDMEDAWLTKIVDAFISERRAYDPPMLGDFRPALARAREDIAEAKKKRHTADAQRGTVYMGHHVGAKVEKLGLAHPDIAAWIALRGEAWVKEQHTNYLCRTKSSAPVRRPA